MDKKIVSEFIYLFNKDLLSAYSIPDTVLDTWNIQ